MSIGIAIYIAIIIIIIIIVSMSIAISIAISSIFIISSIMGSHLSDTTCLRRVFFNSGEQRSRFNKPY